MLLIDGVSKGKMEKLEVSETFYKYHNAVNADKIGEFLLGNLTMGRVCDSRCPARAQSGVKGVTIY